MSNKQIHELRNLDKLDFNPATDNFLVQKKGGGTYKSSITHLIDSPSANLPGTKSWAWNWLDEPEDLIGYRMTFQTGAVSLLRNRISASWLKKEVDGKKEASSIPSSARSVLISCFSRNCDVLIHKSRTVAVKNEKVLALTGRESTRILHYGKPEDFMSGPSKPLDGMCSESLFIVEHVSLPGDRTQGNGVTLDIDSGSFISFDVITHPYEVKIKTRMVRTPEPNKGFDSRPRGIFGLRTKQIDALSIPVSSSSSPVGNHHSELFYVKMHAWA